MLCIIYELEKLWIHKLFIAFLEFNSIKVYMITYLFDEYIHEI
jgi:hypothetical protein